MKAIIIVLLLCLLAFFFTISTAIDTISATKSLKDGESIVSPGGIFELGFFSPGRSKNRYLGIWYKKVGTGTVVWVANRDVPLKDSSGVLQFSRQGILSLVNKDKIAIWSSNSSITATSPVAQLLDTGNLVVKNEEDNEPENYLWQSFDYPGDTLLPGMKYGVNFVTGLNRGLTSWKSDDDPSEGDYINKLDPNGLPQFFLEKGLAKQFRSGPWNGLRFSGMPNLKPNGIYTYEFVFTQEEVYYTYNLVSSSVVSRLVLIPNGNLQRYTWIDRTKDWKLYLTAQIDDCDRYATCGAYGRCNIDNSPACGCLEGFVPKSPEEWYSGDWSNGCIRKAPLECMEGEGFRRYTGIKLPDTSLSWYNKTMNLKVCEQACLKNCSCTAYANLDIREGGSGCILWFKELFDVRQYADSSQDIYIRMAKSDLGIRQQDSTDELIRNEDLHLFGFNVIVEATNNFSNDNKLGQGGFGPVYKGKLKDGQEIAVKRLSKNSRQGLDEFKNEVFCIAKLQHRNLVKLLGCCIEAEERMLIYEYMPNKSLNLFIFDEKQSVLVDWPKRFHIINGIARGLLYLHQDSRLRIVHRDLKASNVLLDQEMNPKISDFGMARGFRGDETEANTSRVVGTYGYMSPEYTIDGIFSLKSDVFSFGVLVPEIVSGKKNRGFRHAHHKLNLLGHAWMLHKEGKSLELIDKFVKDSCNEAQALRSIHVALLCVQRSPGDRPSMSNVVLMLSSEIALPTPKEPGFFTERHLSDTDSSSTKHEQPSTINRVTITVLEAR
ncbi:G-type lectin S-receptor-like serine/threonine-protein kinase At4g27290 isoform X2 [Morus notabilis]|uniref:G-type lectin S-receptor-like serine/threonine-protein kinase At4g27290 isoform X2 n=1 Tax=Morus notabilis TaxID=981085 RepID=UPI000CED22BC|nr:G-type lectin S-receptor-like serine/threonine-protein kinase At4g27290 isoform X2 [Morus notabilis]